MTKADRKPMQNEYDEYKVCDVYSITVQPCNYKDLFLQSIKTRLLTVDNLLKKADPQKTI